MVLISGVVGSGAYGDDPLLGVVYGLLTAISYALFLLILRQAGSSERPPAGRCSTPRCPRRCSARSPGSRSATSTGRRAPESQAWLVLLALSSQVLGWMLISVSLPRLPAALTSIVLMLQPVSTVLLGAVLLDEAPSAVQLSGVAIVLAAVAFATLGARSRASRRLRQWPRDAHYQRAGWFTKNVFNRLVAVLDADGRERGGARGCWRCRGERAASRAGRR